MGWGLKSEVVMEDGSGMWYMRERREKRESWLVSIIEEREASISPHIRYKKLRTKRSKRRKKATGPDYTVFYYFYFLKLVVGQKI